VAGGGREVVMENTDMIGGNGEKESRVSSRGEDNNTIYMNPSVPKYVKLFV